MSNEDKTAKAKEARKAADNREDDKLVAAIAASIMPRMSSPMPKNSLSPIDLKRHLWAERNCFPFDLTLPDGTSEQEVFMQEALVRARMLLTLAKGEKLRPNPMQRLAAYQSIQCDAVERALPNLEGRTEPIPWLEFARLVIKSNDDMLERYWKAFRKSDLFRSEDNIDLKVVWESEATAADRGNPNVTIWPDQKWQKAIDLDPSIITNLIGMFRNFYDRSGASVRQRKLRAAGKTGGLKAQRIRKHNEGS